MDLMSIRRSLHFALPAVLGVACDGRGRVLIDDDGGR
jgi:hypothetical protein